VKILNPGRDSKHNPPEDELKDRFTRTARQFWLSGMSRVECSEFSNVSANTAVGNFKVNARSVKTNTFKIYIYTRIWQGEDGNGDVCGNVGKLRTVTWLIPESQSYAHNFILI
jgi:hypothetical protein